MHIDDMKAPQRAQTAAAAGYAACGAVLALAHHRFWLVGILGFVLIAMAAGRLRGSQPGFDRVQWFAGLCALCKLVYMTLGGLPLAASLLGALLPVLGTLLFYALWQGFGRMCAQGNRLGRAALCAQMLCAALCLARGLWTLDALGGLTPPVQGAAQRMALGFEILAAGLLAAFLLIKRRKLKEEEP